MIWHFSTAYGCALHVLQLTELCSIAQGILAIIKNVVVYLHVYIVFPTAEFDGEAT